jgi:hypothetical protein
MVGNKQMGAIMIEFIAFAFMTAICSAAHGNGKEKKLIIVASHAAFVYMICGAIFIPFAFAWWGLFRRGWQAKAELDFLGGKASISKVSEGYPHFMNMRISEIIAICKTRREQEFLLGLYTGAALGLIAMVGSFFYG